MNELRVGAILRALRLRRGWRQEDLARRAGVSRQLVSKIERGDLDSTSLRDLRAVSRALGVDAGVTVAGYGRDLDRLVSAGHAAMHETMARRLAASPAWTFAPEVSFSLYGERGVIDVLGWHREGAALLVIELKTSVIDVNDLMATMDRRRRLAPRIAAERGWHGERVGLWVAVADTTTNHRRVAAHASVLRSAFPDDGRAVRRWLGDPQGRLAALSFLSSATCRSTRSAFGPVRRVSGRSPRSNAR